LPRRRSEKPFLLEDVWMSVLRGAYEVASKVGVLLHEDMGDSVDNVLDKVCNVTVSGVGLRWEPSW
jgi:hypothetical protein